MNKFKDRILEPAELIVSEVTIKMLYILGKHHMAMWLTVCKHKYLFRSCRLVGFANTQVQIKIYIQIE